MPKLRVPITRPFIPNIAPLGRLQSSKGSISQSLLLKELPVFSEDTLRKQIEKSVSSSTGSNFSTGRISAMVKFNPEIEVLRRTSLVDLLITRNENYELLVACNLAPTSEDKKAKYHKVISYSLGLTDVCSDKKYELQIYSGNPIYAKQAHDRLVEKLFQSSTHQNPVTILEQVALELSRTQNQRNKQYLKIDLAHSNTLGISTTITYKNGKAIRYCETGRKESNEE